jgi:hypothetical protein
MSFKNRMVTRATGAAQAARDAASERLDGFRAFRRLIERTPDEDPRFEAFLEGLVRAVRDDELPEDRTEKDVEKTANKRRRRLGATAFATGPLVGATTQLVDLYCDTATMCDVASHRGHELTDAQVAAHMLVLWSVADDFDQAIAAFARDSDGGVTALLSRRLSAYAGTYQPERWTTVGLIKATWNARGLLGDARQRLTTGPVRGVIRPGKQTRDLIRRVDLQLRRTHGDPRSTT